MKYRLWEKANREVSEIGFGLSKLKNGNPADYRKTIEFGLENGINFFDGCITDFRVYGILRDAVRNSREKIITQYHFGPQYDENGVYSRTRDQQIIRDTFDRMMEASGFDYTDIGMLHCVDTDEEYAQAVDSGLLDYVCGLKDKGIVRHVGVSVHTPQTAERFIDTGKVDFFMFSINAAFDYTECQWGWSDSDARYAFYERCAREKIGISAMKPFAVGQLLDAKASPIGVALTVPQCIQYVLDRPGVLTVIPGIPGVPELENILSYYDTSAEERDYAAALAKAEVAKAGRCVYCNHCAPCPEGIDVGLVNKYYDLAKNGDELAADHYRKLKLSASDCTGCGHCAENCPFSVDQPARMEEIAEYFE